MKFIFLVWIWRSCRVTEGRLRLCSAVISFVCLVCSPGYFVLTERSLQCFQTHEYATSLLLRDSLAVKIVACTLLWLRWNFWIFCPSYILFGVHLMLPANFPRQMNSITRCSAVYKNPRQAPYYTECSSYDALWTDQLHLCLLWQLVFSDLI